MLSHEPNLNNSWNRNYERGSAIKSTRSGYDRCRILMPVLKSTDISFEVPITINEHKLKKAVWVITVLQTNLQYVATKIHPKSATVHIGYYWWLFWCPKPTFLNSLHCKGGANKDVETRVEYVTLTLESSWYSVQPRYRSEDLNNKSSYTSKSMIVK
jgi:hypothetical protein